MRAKRHFRNQILTLIGGSLLYLPDGALWTWGNLSVYVLSYMRMKNIEETALPTPWLISIFAIAYTIGAIVAGTASKIFGCKATIAVGILLFDGGLFLSYFTVQHSMNGLNFTNGFMPGLGYGIITCLVTQNAIEWADGNKGLFTSLVQACSTLGGTLNIQLASHYINPNNETPYLELGSITLFPQTDIIRNVPSVYLVLGAVNLGIHLIGFILLRVQYATKDSLKDESKSLNRNTSLINSSEKDAKAGFGVDIPEEANPNSEDPQQKNNTKFVYMPTEILRCRTFYLLWFVLFCNDWGKLIYSNYYKIFGQSYITNDYFLANVGTVMTIAAIASRIGWGLVVDRIGVKWVMVLFLALCSLLFATYYFGPMLSKWMFIVWTVLVTCNYYIVFSNFTIATLKMFGEKNFASNYGLVLSIGAILNLGGPPLLKLQLQKFGWFVVFITPGILNFLSLILVIVALPRI